MEASRSGDALLVVDGLRLSFGGLAALDGVAFNVTPGRITALIGPNGAGKTTLFNAVSGLVRPHAGSVRLRGEEILGLKPEQITARGMVRSFQIARGFPRLSVFEHLMLYGRDQPGEQWITALFGATAARPPGFSRRKNSAKNSNSVFLVFTVASKSFAVPSKSSEPANGGLARISEYFSSSSPCSCASESL